MGRWLRRIAIAVGVLILILVLFVTLTRPGRTAFKTALFVPQVLPAVPVKPQEWFTPDPERTEVSFPTPSGTGVADLYRIPDGKERAAVLLFLGVNPAGRDDPRLVNLAGALARAGFVVLIPWSEAMVEKRIDVDAIEDLVWAFQYLQGLDYVDPGRVGMGGFCVGASMATVAAEDPRVREEVAFINFFGGYYDARDLVGQIASQTSFYDGTQDPWEPGDLTREVFTTHLIEGLDSPQERDLLTRVFIDGQEATAQELEGLSPQGQVVYRLLEGVSLEEAQELIPQLPPRELEVLDRISPSGHIGALQARVLIMHDREDNLVPSEESRRLAEALERRGNVYYTEFSFFQHMDPNRRVGFLTFVKEAVKLYQHLYNIIGVAA